MVRVISAVELQEQFGPWNIIAADVVNAAGPTVILESEPETDDEVASLVRRYVPFHVPDLTSNLGQLRSAIIVGAKRALLPQDHPDLKW